MSLTAESFNAVQVTTINFEITDAQFKQLTINGQAVDIIYARYQNEVKFKINLELVISKALITNGLRFQFNKFFRDGNTILTTDSLVFGTLTQEQYLLNYCKANLSKLYTLDLAEFYVKGIPNPLATTTVINFSQVSYANLVSNGYILDSNFSQPIQINNTGSAILTGSITGEMLNAGGLSIVPKLKINYI
jgi:citrate lyase alpha subunit